MALAHPRTVYPQTRHKRRLPAPGAALEEAVARYQDFLRRKQALGDEVAVAACYLEIGDLYLACGETERAGDMYRKSLEISQRIGPAPGLSL